MTIKTLGTPKGDDAAAIDKGGYRPQVQETLVLAPFSAQCEMSNAWAKCRRR